MIMPKTIDNLYRIASNLSYKDYRAVNNGKQKKFVPYSLSDDTREADEYLKIAQKENVSIEEEESIKAYVMKIRKTQEHLLTDTNGNYEQWKRVSEAR